MKYIDIHCHLDFKDYDPDRAEVLARMQAGEVGAITIGTDLESSKRAVAIAEQNENVWACIGMHPAEETGRGVCTGFDENEFGVLVKNPKVVAVGECGLDWFRVQPEKMQEERKRQTNLFEAQINFALSHDKPLMLHCRDSYDDVLDILEFYKKQVGDKLRGNAHFFAGNKDQAKRFLDLGFTASFTGVITFPSRLGETGTTDYDEVIKFLPRGSFMSETDAPFVAPTPYRGKRNEPAFVVEVVKKIAEIRGESEVDIKNEILSTARKVFGLPLQN